MDCVVSFRGLRAVCAECMCGWLVRCVQVAYTHYMSIEAAKRDLGYAPILSHQDAMIRMARKYVELQWVDAGGWALVGSDLVGT